MFREASNRIYKSVVLIWLTLSVAVVALSGLAWHQLREALRISQEAVAIKEAAERILTALLDAETSQRGFALTGKEEFLQPFKSAEAGMPAQFELLGALVSGDTNLMNRVLDLRARSELLLEFHRKVIAERRERGITAAGELVSQGQGKALMDEVRQRLAVLASARGDLTSAEARASSGQLLRANLTSLIAAIVGLGAGFFSLYLAQKSREHKVRENELDQARMLAESESREKSTFLANMSHEIRTPMNAILGFSELLAGDLQNPKHRDYVRSIRTSATSLLQLINDLLDMSKVEAGLVELRPEPTDPREICEFVKILFSGPAAKRRVRLLCKVAEDLPRALLLDRGRLRQILVNLVSNAVKFTDRGRIDVVVNWEKQPDSSSRITLIIEVEDTGVGIPKDKLDLVFKPFVQAGVHPDKEKSGSGLGLAIVRQLVHLMGGTITVASVAGQGSAFHLRFPDVPVSVRLPLTEGADAAPDFNSLKPARILAVDDNEMNCRLVASMFEGSRHQVEFGSDGQQAIAKARAFRPDLILLDIRMPEMDGPEALDEIRKIPGMDLLPVIAVTASSVLESEKALREKFNGYLRKPFTRRELFDEIAQFLPKAEKQPDKNVKVDGAASARPAWGAVARGLRGLESKEWSGLRESLAISESREFAHKLEKLGREADCEPLLIYAQSLSHYAETYNVDALEKHIHGFTALIERIEKS
jgi:signal transduction histidine kinase/response regulator of citrate/malate metabolism